MKPKIFSILFFLFVVLCTREGFSESFSLAHFKNKGLGKLEFSQFSPAPFSSKLRSDKNKKIVAAALAFPFPCGFFGGHRLYLGTQPVVPIVYVATLGGCFGILPFIDCMVILLDKDTQKYENNSKIFMWVK